jgi:hypothetical protein
MIQLFDQKEKDNLKRLDQVISYCLGNRCSYQVLLEHFHEEIPPCGHCHYCQNPHQIDSLPSTRPAEITTDDLEVIKNLGSARYPALRTPRLHGIFRLESEEKDASLLTMPMDYSSRMIFTMSSDFAKTSLFFDQSTIAELFPSSKLAEFLITLGFKLIF